MVEVTIENYENGVWVPQDITLDVDADMALSDETLDQEMCALPRKIAQYAEISAELHALMLRKKNDVEAAEGELAQSIRMSHAASGEKLTEPAIKEKINQSPIIRKFQHDAFDAERQYRKVDGFYRSLREKASLAIALCYKQKAEITAMSGPLN